MIDVVCPFDKRTVQKEQKRLIIAMNGIMKSEKFGSVGGFMDIINPYNYLLKNTNFSIKTNNK